MIIASCINIHAYTYNVETLFAKYNCSCIEVEVTDFKDYTDVETSLVIPDAVKKVNLHCTLCACILYGIYVHACTYMQCIVL